MSGRLTHARPSTQRPVGLQALAEQIAACRACPRLVAWREEVAQTRRAAFAHEPYWGRGVPGFGDPDARLLILGLAPAAHGANRTGRVFTGDRSGDFLFAALHRAGYANQATSRHRGDGLALRDCWVSAAVRCAPPGNKPTADERTRCFSYLETEFGLMKPKVLLALGSFAWKVALDLFDSLRPRPTFGHGAEVSLPGVTLLGSYHVSQQNTFTGRLTPEMFDEVLARSRTLLSD